MKRVQPGHYAHEICSKEEEKKAEQPIPFTHCKYCKQSLFVGDNDLFIKDVCTHEFHHKCALSYLDGVTEAKILLT